MQKKVVLIVILKTNVNWFLDINFQLLQKDGFLAKDEVKEVIKSSIRKVNIKFDDALMEDLCQNLGELLSIKVWKIFFLS